MSGVLAGFVVLLAVIALGYLLGRLELLGPEATQVLSRLTFYVATPALLFTTLADADPGAVFSPALAANAAAIAVVACLFALVSGLLWRRPAADTVVGALAATYVNAANLGIPVAVYVLGDASYVAPVLLFQLLVMAPVGLAVLGTAAATPTRDPQRSLLQVISQPVRTPVTVGCLLGLVLSISGRELPEITLRPVELVGAVAVPLALIAYGLSLHGAPLPGSGDTRRDVWLAVLLKNVAQPAVAYLIGRFALGLEGTTLLGITVTAALPTAQNVFVYAVTYDRGTTVARDAVLLTTLLSVPVLVVIATLAA